MDTEYIKQLIHEEVKKELQNYGLIEKDKPKEQVSRYNRMCMRDTWYND